MTLAPRGTEVALPPFDAATWKSDTYKNRLKIELGNKDGSSYCRLTGDEEGKDTAWFVRSPRFPLTANGERFFLSFALETTRTVPVNGGRLEDSFEPFAVRIYKW